MADPVRVDQLLCFALYSASRAFTRAYAPLLEPLGLTYPQYLVMLVLWDEGSATIGSLGERLALDSGTLTPLVKRLEQGGLVARRRDAADERVVRVELTAAGKALKARARKVPAALACRAGYDLDDDRAVARLARLRDELTALARELDASAPPA